MSRRRAVGVGLLFISLGACTPPPPERDSCMQVIGGTWRVTAPAAYAGHEWAIVDGGSHVELYALSRAGGATAMDDVAATLPPGMQVAPTAIDLDRTTAPGGIALTGMARRRYMQAGVTCIAKVPASIAGCRGTQLKLNLPPMPPPINITSCPAGSAPTPVVLTLQQLAEAR